MSCLQSEDRLAATETHKYQLTKALASWLEANNILTLQLLHAYILLALYEICNAYYPAAYLTVGHCARLGYAYGLNDIMNAVQVLPKPQTFVEQEERRRTWWAGIIPLCFIGSSISLALN